MSLGRPQNKKEINDLILFVTTKQKKGKKIVTMQECLESQTYYVMTSEEALEFLGYNLEYIILSPTSVLYNSPEFVFGFSFEEGEPLELILSKVMNLMHVDFTFECGEFEDDDSDEEAIDLEDEEGVIDLEDEEEIDADVIDLED